MAANNIYERVLSLQKVPNGGFTYINKNEGITLSSGQQFYIDSVYTGFFPPVSPLSTDKDKYRKQKWLSIGLEGNSFRRYINENTGLQGIPDGLQPGNFVYYTIEPKSSLLESGAGNINSKYISSLRAKPYMVIENDAKRDNSYDKTPSNLFTGVSGNNNFVVFNSKSKYSGLALQSIRFHPVIGNGYASYDLLSGKIINIQPKNHHLETFIEINLKSGNKINYGNKDRQSYFLTYPTIASGRAFNVAGAPNPEANGIYVGNNSNLQPSYYINENNYRLYNSGNTQLYVIAQPNNSNISYTIAPDLINFTNIYRSSGNANYPYNYSKFGSNNSVYLGQNNIYTSGWRNIGNSLSVPLIVSNMVTFQLGATPSLYILGSGRRFGSFASANVDPTGAYLLPKYSTFDLPLVKIGKYMRFTTDVRGVAYNSASTLNTFLRYFNPNFIFENEGIFYFPNTTLSSLQNEILKKERVNFKRPLSPNLHQAKKVNLKILFERDDKAIQNQLVIKNTYPVIERIYTDYNRLIEFYDEKDNNTYADTPFYIISGKDYEFDQKELFVYRSRPDFNDPNKQSVIKW
jgi:hypothetical protein